MFYDNRRNKYSQVVGKVKLMVNSGDSNNYNNLCISKLFTYPI